MNLYEITRGMWNQLPKNYDSAEFAFSVYKGIIQEVYEIAGWFKANTTQYFTRQSDPEETNRMEFVGKIAKESIRNMYRHKSIISSKRSYGRVVRGYNLY
ncbi:MAG: hypothetical protein JW870_07235 [Candidatus Delongbacteria bacterium]|nr:hypothetical protein [Candidatus Delongbacteria bacterium]